MVALDHRGHGRGIRSWRRVPPRGLRRRRRRPARRARPRAGHPRRLLDGRPDRPAPVAPPPRPRRRPGAVRHRRPASATGGSDRALQGVVTGLSLAVRAAPELDAQAGHRAAGRRPLRRPRRSAAGPASRPGCNDLRTDHRGRPRHRPLLVARAGSAASTCPPRVVLTELRPDRCRRPASSAWPTPSPARRCIPVDGDHDVCAIDPDDVRPGPARRLHRRRRPRPSAVDRHAG